MPTRQLPPRGPHSRVVTTSTEFLNAFDPTWQGISGMRELAYEFSNGRVFEKDARDQFIGARLTADSAVLSSDTTLYSADQTNKRADQ